MVTSSLCSRLSQAAERRTVVRYASLADSVGNTPLVGLPRLSPSATVRLWISLTPRCDVGYP